jgi:Domain of unknown function (DUF222)
VSVPCSSIVDMGREDRHLADEIRTLHRQISQLQAKLVRCVGRFDAIQGYEPDEYRSTQSWLRHELRVHPREAAHLVGMARQLRHLPAVDDAFAAGEISQTHVAVIARTARQIGVEHIAASQDTLLSVATTGSPERLRVATQHLRYCIDPDAVDRDAVKAYEKRELSVAPTIWGMVAIQGMLDPTSGATVLAALDALTPPPRDTDSRTAGQRRADALTELCRRALDAGTLPQVNGEKPHVLVTVPYETLAQQVSDQPASLTWVGPISATDARMLACDCAIIPAVLGSAGEVLDIGRKTRVWPTAIRRAIELRDKTCRYVDCDVPAQHCDIHHKVHWAHGGSTSYHGGVLACRTHHTQAHRYGTTVRPDGRFTVNRN